MDENWGATVARIEPAKDGPGAPEGNQNAVKGEENNVGSSDIDTEPKRDTRKRSNKDPERIIARLKRDAADPACPGWTQARHWLKRLEADLARRQTDPASPEFVKKGARNDLKHVSNAYKSSPKERNSKPGTLRRLARSHPDLLARVESGELSAHAPSCWSNR